ncbi:hypothetical protein KC717_03475 [Candidatus Dojkabacteria bacterium]|uniref:Uncharacterized protein n=1 Tax=Candidatus Dojkabacteria bacterium TaxID=2099670 RepID=A0A955L7Z9_9BACT|nr:hypothetical protein [Candidatus Dojkabacteria bacterium]
MIEGLTQITPPTSPRGRDSWNRTHRRFLGQMIEIYENGGTLLAGTILVQGNEIFRIESAVAYTAAKPLSTDISPKLQINDPLTITFHPDGFIYSSKFPYEKRDEFEFRIYGPNRDKYPDWFLEGQTREP